MAKKKKAQPKKKAKKRSGLTVGANAMSGTKKKKAKKRSGTSFGQKQKSWKRALIASSIMRLASGGVAYIAQSQNMGQELPKIKIAVPLAVATLSYYDVIPSPDMFPAGVQGFVDAAVDNTQFLKDLFDFKFMAKKPAATSGPLRVVPQQGVIMRRLESPEIRARSGNGNSPLADYMEDRGASFRH